MRKWGGALAGVLMVLGMIPAAAAEIVPGVLYALGEKFDKSFNESAYNAFERFEGETGIGYLEFAPRTATQFEQGISAMARRGANAIVVVGFYYAQSLDILAPRYPDIRFTLIDGVATAPNVRSVTFREQEGAFLTGVLAAMTSRTGKVGFVGAIDIPLIRKFVTGFEAGARHADPETGFYLNFVGTTPAAFNDPTTAGELTRSQIERGADVIFAGAGNSNMGIFQVAEDLGVFAIGVDSNQNHLYPGTILTSMLKRVDVAVYETLQAVRNGTWQAGTVSLGLAEGGVGYAVDEHNRDLLTPGMLAAAEAAKAAIVAGDIVVPDPLAEARLP